MAKGVEAVAGSAAICAALILCAPAAAPAAPGASAADPHDIAGLWMNENTLDERLKREGRHRLDPGEADGVQRVRPSLKPAYEAIYAKLQADAAQGAASCRWVGLPGIMGYPYPFEILVTPGRITMIFEADSQVRRIWMTRRRHPAPDDLDPSYYGDSIGQWEGDTLVVDTVGFNTQTTVNGAPHSERMHIVERIRHLGAKTLEDRMTITDPEAFTAPVTQTFVYGRRPGWRIREYSCNENNRDAPDASGARLGGRVGSAGAN
jgi:hypothetical protein